MSDHMEIDGLLIETLWQSIKIARDEAEENAGKYKREAERLNYLLQRMRAAGMADHLPTIEEVQAAWRS